MRGCIKWTIERAGIERLADFNSDRIDKTLSIVASLKRLPRTVNVYRKCAFSLAEWAVRGCKEITYTYRTSIMQVGFSRFSAREGSATSATAGWLVFSGNFGHCGQVVFNS